MAEIQCPQCEGSGTIIGPGNEQETCPRCNGSGSVPDEAGGATGGNQDPDEPI